MILKRNILLIVALFIAHPAYSAESIKSARKAASKQLNESVERFKRCLRLNCTKMEAVKAARDVTIATIGAITAMYVVGKGLESGGLKLFKKSKEGSRKSRLAMGVPGIGGYYVGRALQMPGEVAVRRVGSATASVLPDAIKPYMKGEILYYTDDFGDPVEVAFIKYNDDIDNTAAIEINGRKYEIKVVELRRTK